MLRLDGNLLIIDPQYPQCIRIGPSTNGMEARALNSISPLLYSLWFVLWAQRLEAELKQSYATKNFTLRDGLLEIEKRYRAFIYKSEDAEVRREVE